MTDPNRLETIDAFSVVGMPAKAARVSGGATGMSSSGYGAVSLRRWERQVGAAEGFGRQWHSGVQHRTRTCHTRDHDTAPVIQYTLNPLHPSRPPHPPHL
jgi:hypothetical protein